ncbi:hypothetical protein [Methylobacterium pseudosasicola]|uniref:Haemolysin XhlA n=1 Tax=Methylobacterium pseudosasicola TaxID=582667 RepID=A0A1I4U1A0_9HYPH|nr:hypothetical protein [Methylobacterium pseudosasicola]SFM82591.1 hypothetical protein SAMN05192568_106125 [Methylobacterium pseudosasicola]
MAATLIPDAVSRVPMPPLPDETSDAPLLSGQGDLKSDVRLLAYQVALLDKKLDRFFDEVKNNYATKGEVKDLKDDVDKLNANIGWLVKIIIGAVVVALLGLVIVKGGIAPR